MESEIRFDSLVRTERYYTATLLPLILFHDGFRGLDEFLKLLGQRTATARDSLGNSTAWHGPAPFSPERLEIITEFHIARDLTFAGALPATELEAGNDEEKGGKRDAPDLVIALDDQLVVCEGKFFGGCERESLNAQLRSQRRQVRLLFSLRPGLRCYRHVALLPFTFDPAPDCDVVVTWSDVAQLSARILGKGHYVTRRLEDAVRSFDERRGDPGIRNFDGMESFEEVCKRCLAQGDGIQVGHMGGEGDLLSQSAQYLRGKLWKWRDPRTNQGVVEPRNWISDRRFLEIAISLFSREHPSTASSQHSSEVSSRPIAGAPARQTATGPRPQNYEDKLPLGSMLQMCRKRGDQIQVGHTGGAADLRKRGIAYARQKSWKWRNPLETGGVAVPANWIGGESFLRLIEELDPSAQPLSR